MIIPPVLSGKRFLPARGQAVIESIAGIIIFCFLMALMISFVIYLYMQQALITVAREGARQAALSPDGDFSDVPEYVSDMWFDLTGQGNSTVTVTGPTPSDADPDVQVVTVNVTSEVQNPIPVPGFTETFELNAQASMRYEI